MTRQIKNYKVLKELLIAPYHPKLVALALWCYTRWSHFTITSGYRDGDPGVHGQWPCRGLDVRSRDFPNPGKLAADANSLWIYDPHRLHKKCVVYHNAGSGFHFHLQVHDRTKYLVADGNGNFHDHIF